MKKIIFHHPLPLDKDSKSASGIRPLKMIDAFKSLGYSVVVVSGYCKDRKRAIDKIKKEILSGVKYDFVYSESSTQPTLLTEKNHLPKCPFLDFDFFNFCKNNHIKIGIFYRDIYWLFPEYGSNLSFLKRSIAKLFYRYDLKKYNELVDIVYLPSMQMSKYIPTIKQSKFKALPPGHDENKTVRPRKHNDVIGLLYIGGIGSHYQMHKLFKVLKKFPKIHFTLCTRKNEWDSVKDDYKLLPNIFIVHKSGDELQELYENADIVTLFVKPQKYREFAAPVKLYEYIGKEKPIIGSKGTLAGEFIEQNGIGWSVEYNEEALEKLLKELSVEQETIATKRETIKQIKNRHSWYTRAKQVKENLS